MARKKRLIKKERKRWYQHLTSWTLRLLVVVIVLAVIAVGMLSLLAGTGDMQRRGLQQAMTQMIGMKAEIGDLVALKVVPQIVVEVRDVTFKPILGTEKIGSGDTKQTQSGTAAAPQTQQRLVTGPVEARIGRARITLSAWHLLTGSGVFSQFTLENLRMEAGLLGTGVLEIDNGALKASDERETSDIPAWVFDGRYAGRPLSGAIGLDVNTSGGDGAQASYYLGAATPLALTIGDYHLKSTLREDKGGSSLHDTVVKHKQNVIAKGKINSRPASSGDHYTARLDFGQSQAKADIKYTQDEEDQSKLEGNITFAKLYLEDFDGKPDSLMGFADFISTTFAKTPKDTKPQPIDLGDMPVTLNIKIARMISGERSIGHIKLPVQIRNNTLRIAPINGELAGGPITGDFELDAGELPAELAFKAHIADSNYTALQKAGVKGHANLDIDITAKGKTWPALYRHLDGHISLLAGRGELAGSALNIWGGGLINAMIPDFSSKSKNVLNCAVAHFKLKNSLATAAPLFLDTQQVTIKGAGTINLRKQKKALNLVLKPNAKQAAPFDIATAVNVTGPLANPSIMPDLVSSAGKVGGLLLGAVNPAFLAFSMTDLGLTDQDPCKAFLRNDGSGKARQTMPGLDKPDGAFKKPSPVQEKPVKQKAQETGKTAPTPDKQTGQTPN